MTKTNDLDLDYDYDYDYDFREYYSLLTANC